MLMDFDAKVIKASTNNFLVWELINRKEKSYNAIYYHLRVNGTDKSSHFTKFSMFTELFS